MESVFKSKYPNYEVILVDNGSTDGSCEFVKKSFSRLIGSKMIVIEKDRNLGHSEGRNVGIRVAKGTYLLFLDNDTEVDPEWINPLVSAMESDHSIGAVQGKLLFLDDRNQIDSAGGFIDYLGYPIERGNRKYDNNSYPNLGEIFYAKTACMMTKRSVLREVGLFDPLFFVWYGETDLAWRMWLRGYRVVFVGKSIVYHSLSGTISKLSQRFRLFHYVRNRLIMLLKNYSFRNLVYLLPLNLAMELKYLGMLLLRHDLHRAASVTQALMWVLSNNRIIIERRRVVQQQIRRAPDSLVMRRMLKITLGLLFYRRKYGLNSYAKKVASWAFS